MDALTDAERGETYAYTGLTLGGLAMASLVGFGLYKGIAGTKQNYKFFRADEANYKQYKAAKKSYIPGATQGPEPKYADYAKGGPDGVNAKSYKTYKSRKFKGKIAAVIGAALDIAAFIGIGILVGSSLTTDGNQTHQIGRAHV